MEISRRAFAEQLALMAAAPWFVEDLKPPMHQQQQQQQPQEPSALAKALAETVHLRYPDRFSADDLAAITRSIDGRLRAIERLYQTTLTNADEPDFVYSVYRGAD
ncbi:MAG: hypothetical protein AUH41_12645 [Gemmatimonadetes bacterium 13_1_40CM_66_11]|nr:MAG: hypothetical protein AUH41_12645 [Gemmatimonadetes bacterium 13_1_40CM_66_11]